MTAPRNILTVALAVVGAGKLADAQDFITNCTWQAGILSGSFLGMYCNNDDWEHFYYDWTCGGYRTSCQDCAVRGSSVDYFLTCDCLNTANQVTSTSYDLNRAIWNHNGSLGCFDHIGNKTRDGPF
ncbi:hypothetical protein F5B20DRAFT_585683 [Whalleya microplaca]|nr:hypothetical protein F5B20DRAFT_585683 [Whalleya microplaca]